MSGTGYSTTQCRDGEVLGITHGASEINKFGVSAMGKSLGAELGTEVGFLMKFQIAIVLES